MADEPADVLEVPGRISGHRQQHSRFRFARLGHRDAAPSGLEEVAAAPKRMCQGLARITDGSQVLGEAVEELEEVEFRGWGQHDSGSRETVP